MKVRRINFSEYDLEDYASLTEDDLKKLTDSQKRILLEDDREKAARNASKIIRRLEREEAKAGRESGKKSGKKIGRRIGAATLGTLGAISAVGLSRELKNPTIAKSILSGAAGLAAGGAIGGGLGHLAGGSIGASIGEESGRSRGKAEGSRRAKEGGHNRDDILIKESRILDDHARRHKKDDHWETDARALLKKEKSDREEAARKARAEALEKRRVEAEEMRARADRERARNDTYRYLDDYWEKRRTSN